MAKYLNRYLKEHPVDVIFMPHLVPGGDHFLYEKEGNASAADRRSHDGLYLHSLLGGDLLRLLHRARIRNSLKSVPEEGFHRKK